MKKPFGHSWSSDNNESSSPIFQTTIADLTEYGLQIAQARQSRHGHDRDDGPLQTVQPTTVLFSSDMADGVATAPKIIQAAGGSSGSTTTGTLVVTGNSLVSSTTSGLKINLVWDASVSSAPTGFQSTVLQVAQYFVDHFSDNVTLNINVGFGESGGYSLGSALGMSLSYLQSTSYAQIKSALTADKTTAADASAVASLTGDPSVGGNYWITTAEAKALGLLTSTTNTDGFVGFSSTAGIFDYDNTNGITAGQYDFFGVVAHEISEVMGRMLLTGGTIGSTAPSYDVLDLFHFSANGVHTLSGTTAGYFSVDNGATNLHNFNISASGGDRGDWASSSTPDAFDAFGTPGVVLPIGSFDLTALDAIGWNAIGSTTPTALPDLTASGVSLNLSTSVVSFTLNNIGSGAATFGSAPAASLYLSTDTTITSADKLLGSIAGGFTLAAGTSKTGTVTLTAQATAGTYYIGALADASGAVAETNETNNVSSVGRVILGTTGADTLNGTSSADVILGFGGNDTIKGGAGNDILVGGAGADHFVFSARSEGVDTIVDFAHLTDVLDFAALGFGNGLATNNANTGTLASSHFASNATGSATAATAQFIQNTTDHSIWFDADGTGATAAVKLVILGNGTTLTATDFHLI